MLIEHGSLGNLAVVQQQIFGLRSGQRVLQFASLNFDASIWEISMALCSGATLYVAPTAALLPGPALTQFLVPHAITQVTLVPSALAALAPDELPALQTIIVAGEACPSPLARRWLSGRCFFNAYSPTETTVCATIMACTAATLGASAPPIGKPIANVQLYILDEEGNPRPSGAAGELYIGGSTLARGYLNRPTLTAEKFIDNPFGTGRLYKTGDLVCTRPDGTIDFLGRIDHQVKIRGYRIELGEIEALLTIDPQVQTAVVVARKAADAQPQLVAYVVMIEPTVADPTATRAALRHLLQTQLPHYMIPAAFVLLPTLPLMPNGKVDRQALPTPTDEAFAADPFMPPQTATEETLAALWSELLGLQQIGRAADFFASGGHSLLATGLITRLRTHFGVELPILTETAHTIQATLEYNRDLFRAATIVRMAGHFQELLNAMLADPTTPIQLLPLLTTAERHQLLVEWNHTATAYPKDTAIHHLFEAQVTRTPHAAALLFAPSPQAGALWDGSQDGAATLPRIGGSVGQDGTFTYSELNAHANQLAHHLRSLGLLPGTVVGLCMERSPALIVGILGILKAGGPICRLPPTIHRNGWLSWCKIPPPR